MALLTCKFCGQKIQPWRRNRKSGKSYYDHGALMRHVTNAHEDEPEVEEIRRWAHESTEHLDQWAEKEGFVPSNSQHTW